MGEASYAVGWTQRLVPFVLAIARRWPCFSSESYEPATVRGSRRRSSGALAAAACARAHRADRAPLRDLVAIDAARAAQVARRALDTFGARLHGLRDAVLAAADAAGDGPSP